MGLDGSGRDTAPGSADMGVEGGGVPSSPRLSVIVACHNAAETIGAALASALGQDGVDLECIVVDDLSTDGTADAAERLAAGDPRVTLLLQPEHAGVSAARNRALDVARGEWLVFLDADDRLRPGALAALLAAADADGALVVVGQRISTDGERTWSPQLYEQPDIRTPGRNRSLAANPGLLYYVGPAGKLFHRSCAAGLRFEGRMLGDQPWVVRALVRAGDRISVIGDVVYEWWRPHPDRYVPTITSARERSALLAVEAVHMAGIAFDVATAAFADAYDPATRARMDAAYFERLLRADLSAQLRTAVRRRDPGLGPLLDALAELVAHVPATVAAGTDAVARELLEPPANAWPVLSAPARRSYARLLEAALAADPRVLTHTRSRVIRLALRARRLPMVGATAGAILLDVRAPVAMLVRRLRRR